MYSIYSCVCHICPRNLRSSLIQDEENFVFFNTKKDFINVCIECGGSGGSVGNVNHRANCMYAGCLHDGIRYTKINNYDEYSDEYIQSLSYLSIDEQVNHRNSYGRWDYNQPSENIRNYHIKCMETRKDEIELARRKMARNVLFKMSAILQIKTGVYINPYCHFDGKNSEKFINKWVKILNRKMLNNSLTGIKA